MASNRTIAISGVLNAAPLNRTWALIVGLCAAINIMDGFDLQVIGFAAPSIIRAWHTPPQSFGQVFSAGLFGMMFGACIMGPAADYFGRRAVLIASTAMFGLFTLLTVTATSVETLMIFRVLTGFAIGAANPIAIALAAEFSPDRHRSTAIMLACCGTAMGTIFAGWTAARLIPLFGWPSVFYVGGVAPLLFVPLLLWLLPESVRFLAIKGNRGAEISRLLKWLDPNAKIEANATFVAEDDRPPGLTIGHLFSDGRAIKTLLLWLVSSLSLLVLFSLISWLPTVISNAGAPIERAVYATTAMQVGGLLGTFCASWVLDRFNACLVLAWLFVGGAVFIVMVSFAATWSALIFPLIFIAGICVTGAQNALNAVAGVLYPTFMRSTGIAWALGVSRVGAIAGPLIGGFLVALNWDARSIVLSAAVPEICAAAATFALAALAWREFGGSPREAAAGASSVPAQ